MIDQQFNLIMILGSSLAGLLILKSICFRCLDSFDNYILHSNNINTNSNDNNYYSDNESSYDSNENRIDINENLAPDASSDFEN